VTARGASGVPRRVFVLPVVYCRAKGAVCTNRRYFRGVVDGTVVREVMARGRWHDFDGDVVGWCYQGCAMDCVRLVGNGALVSWVTEI
jgi:hypothetical protein